MRERTDLNTYIRNIMGNPAKRMAVIVIASILSIFILFGIVDAALFVNKVHGGVTVSGIAVGGMDEKEALAEVNKLASRLEKRTITVKYQGKVWEIDPTELKVNINREKTVQNAFKVGRQNGVFKSIGEKISLWFKPKNILPVFTYDKEKLYNLIDGIAKTVDVPAEDAQLKIIDGRAAITDSKDGRRVDKKSLTNKIQQLLVSKDTYKVALPIKISKPDITADHLDETKKSVTEMIKYPIVLKYRDNTWDVSVRQISGWVAFIKTRKGTYWSLNATFDKDKVSKYLEDLTKGITIEPQDAQFKIEDDDKVTIIPSSDGLQVDLNKAYNDILNASKDPGNREVLLSTVPVRAKLTTEDASKMGIKEKITSFTTFYNPVQAARVHNIRLLGSTLDGSLVAPNEVFSFNGEIGPRTAEKGYQEAPAIMNGKLVPELGGGICQVATTLFNTIFFGGYKVVERYNHSFLISEYPLGRDATVSWGGPDLKFKNDTPTYILIKVKTTASSITISFYGTNQNVKVDYTTNGPTNFTNLAPQTIEDPTLPTGITKQVQNGFSGCDVTVYRTVYRNGAEVRKDKFFSRYIPQKAIIRIGTGAAPAPATSTVGGIPTAGTAQ